MFPFPYLSVVTFSGICIFTFPPSLKSFNVNTYLFSIYSNFLVTFLSISESTYTIIEFLIFSNSLSVGGNINLSYALNLIVCVFFILSNIISVDVKSCCTNSGLMKSTIPIPKLVFLLVFLLISSKHPGSTIIVVEPLHSANSLSVTSSPASKLDNFKVYLTP